MSNVETSLIGLSKFKPSQYKYRNGDVYISLLIAGESIKGLDVRFFYEKGNCLQPTRMGFRVPKDSLDTVFACMKKQYAALDEEIHKAKERSIHIRYVDDKYGKAVDIRYYKESSSYTGWEKRGIRLRAPDFQELQKRLIDIDLKNIELYIHNDIFKGKAILDSGSGNKYKQTEPGNMYINEALQELLG